MFAYMLILTATFKVAASSSFSTDSNQVHRVYVTPDGAIALQLKGGFPRANEAKQCPGNNGWAGLRTGDPVLKSVIIAAKSSGQSLTVTTLGCEGAWIKILNLYL
ncbi:hypothetical protein C1141_20435, partial [Vibrio agarivorans]